MHTDVDGCDCTQGLYTNRKSPLEVDSGRKIPCCTEDLNLHQRGFFSQTELSPPKTWNILHKLICLEATFFSAICNIQNLSLYISKIRFCWKFWMLVTFFLFWNECHLIKMAVCLILAICLSGCHHQVQKAACCNAELKKSITHTAQKRSQLNKH